MPHVIDHARAFGVEHGPVVMDHGVDEERKFRHRSLIAVIAAILASDAVIEGHGRDDNPEEVEGQHFAFVGRLRTPDPNWPFQSATRYEFPGHDRKDKRP
eukprot:5465976-Prymnesium_polylepis.1